MAVVVARSELEADANGGGYDAFVPITVEGHVIGDLRADLARGNADLRPSKEIIVDALAVAVADVGADVRTDVVGVAQQHIHASGRHAAKAFIHRVEVVAHNPNGTASR